MSDHIEATFESGKETIEYPEDMDVIEFITENSKYVENMDINDLSFGEIFEDNDKYPCIFHTDDEIEGMEHYDLIMKYDGHYYYGKGNAGFGARHCNFCYGCYSCNNSSMLLNCSKCEGCTRCINCHKCYNAEDEVDNSYYNGDD